MAGAPELPLCGDIDAVSPCMSEMMQKFVLPQSAKYVDILQTCVFVSVFNEKFGPIYKMPISERLLKE
jgi:hypothetical protein